MTDIARLALRVESLEVQIADRRLGGLASSGGKAERATDGLTSSFGRLLAPLTAAVSAVGALNKLVDVQREFDVLNAGLITATGSSEKAAIAFAALQDFAQKTPYDLAQAVDGFTKLVNLGLTPSEKALTSYGNTASAMGKDLNQMIEAVADAATGEFERLKEFGIKASKQGDEVSFVFQGVKTTVKNNAAEIEGYLTSLGENQFAGAMELRMKTLDGAIANLGDTWDTLFREVSASGIGSVIEEQVRAGTDALQELVDMVASGQMEAYLAALSAAWSGWGDDVSATVDILGEFLSKTWDAWAQDANRPGKGLYLGFAEAPAEIRAYLQEAAAEVAEFVGSVEAKINYIKQAFKNITSDPMGTQALDDYNQEMDRLAAKKADDLETIQTNKVATIDATNQEIDRAKALREEYERQAEVRKKITADRLAAFKVGGDGGSGAASGAADKAAEAEAKRRAKEFESLQTSLLSEEAAIQQSYEKRRAIIEANTQAGSDKRAALMQALDADNATELAALETKQGAELESMRQSLRTQEEVIQESYDKRLAIIQKNTEDGSKLRADMEARLQTEKDTALQSLESQRQSEKDSLYNSLLTEEEMLLRSYERKKQTILDAELITGEERLDLMRRLETQYSNEQAAMENKRMQTQLSTGAALFGGLAGLAKSYGGEQSKAYKALFAVSKAFSIAQAGMSIATGLAKAQELGFPANLGEMARVAATGTQVLGTISGSNFSGAYDNGGNIAAGKFGIVGEYGPEFVEGPVKVTGRRKTAQELAGSGGSLGLNVIINNNSSAQVSAAETTGPDGQQQLEIMIEQVEGSLANKMTAKEGPLYRATRDTFGATPSI